MTQRSNTSTRVRKVSGPTIFGCTAEVIHNSLTRYEKFRSEIGWVEHEDGNSSYSTWAVEILHKDYNGSFNIDTVFLNPKLMKVRTILLPGSSLRLTRSRYYVLLFMAQMRL